MLSHNSVVQQLFPLGTTMGILYGGYNMCITTWWGWGWFWFLFSVIHGLIASSVLQGHQRPILTRRLVMGNIERPQTLCMAPYWPQILAIVKGHMPGEESVMLPFYFCLDWYPLGNGFASFFYMFSMCWTYFVFQGWLRHRNITNVYGTI